MGNGQGITLEEFIPAVEDGFSSDEARYKWQMDLRANFLLLNDSSQHVPVVVSKHSKKFIKTSLKWINRGELIAGSFMSNVTMDTKLNIQSNDIDIYFRQKEDAIDFCILNKIKATPPEKWNISTKVDTPHGVLNLIFGVHYKNEADLITRFDIRACSIAYNPNTNLVHHVVGATQDCSMMRIVFNPIPHNTTVSRLVKYTQKGFGIDPYQRLFFAELIKSEQYNPNLEISTGYRAVHEG